MQDTSIEISLKDKLKDKIEDLELVICYGKSNIPLKVNPLFIEKKDDIDRLIFNKSCINNLATYAYFKATEVKGRIGIVLKPCDVRSIVQLASEELIKKDKIMSIVAGCSGVMDYKKIYRSIGGARVIDAEVGDSKIKIKTIDQDLSFDINDYYADKCYTCTIYDDPFYYDEFLENSEKLSIEPLKEYSDIEAFEKKSLAEISEFWDKEFSRCIRCYACRNICPLEVCRDKCIAQLDSPQWQTQKINKSEGKFFQLIRVFHLAGRCTECGECERVCPVNIPVVKLMKKVNKDILKLFDYRPGYDFGLKPPFLTFKKVEDNIKEENLINE